MDRKRVRSSSCGMSPSRPAWQWASFSRASLRSQCLSLAHTLNRGSLSRAPSSLLLHNVCLLLFHYDLFFPLSGCSTRLPGSVFHFLLFFFFLKGRVSSFSLTTCISPVPQMITKPNFSCEIPPTVSPICGCIMRKRMPWLKRRNAKLILHFLGIFLPLFSHPFALVLFCFQAVLISPLAGSKQVGHVWHKPLTCSQA